LGLGGRKSSQIRPVSGMKSWIFETHLTVPFSNFKKGGSILAAEIFHLKPLIIDSVIPNVSHGRFAHPTNGSLAFLSDSQLH